MLPSSSGVKLLRQNLIFETTVRRTVDCDSFSEIMVRSNPDGCDYTAYLRLRYAARVMLYTQGSLFSSDAAMLFECQIKGSHCLSSSRVTRPIESHSRSSQPRHVWLVGDISICICLSRVPRGMNAHALLRHATHSMLAPLQPICYLTNDSAQ